MQSFKNSVIEWVQFHKARTTTLKISYILKSIMEAL